jgi:hypothetical protein
MTKHDPTAEKSVTDTGDGEYEIGDAAHTAAKVVSESRETHGDPYHNHRQIANLWSAFLDDKLNESLTAWEAAIMMTHVKQSRMQAGELVADHFVDTAGYADVALHCANAQPDETVDTTDIAEQADAKTDGGQSRFRDAQSSNASEPQGDDPSGPAGAHVGATAIEQGLIRANMITDSESRTASNADRHSDSGGE